MLPPVPPEKPRSWEHMHDKRLRFGLGTRELSQTAVLSAIFVVASIFPLSAFIGGAGFITLGIVFVPVIARMLKPYAALVSGLVGSAALYGLQLSIGPVFGPVSLLIPTSGIFLGSIAFHHRMGPIISWAYVAFGAAFYFMFSGGTLVWLAPYVIVVATLPLVLRHTKIRIPLLCLYSTMCELITLNIGSITVLRLSGQLWSVIAPFMFFERTIATIGSLLVITAIRKAIPGFVQEE